MRRPPRVRTRRPAFTLVELMVAMALTILIMAIMSAAFQVGMDSLSLLKSTGTLADHLNSAESTILHDLQANHLLDEAGKPVRVSKLGDPPPLPNEALWAGTGKRGYFAVTQLPWTQDGTDGTVNSYRATDVLQMTVQLPGRNAQEVFMATAPVAVRTPSSFDPSFQHLVSRWAEVSYFLKPNGQMTAAVNDDPSTSVPIHTLYRRQRVLASSATPPLPNGPGGQPNNYEIIDTPDKVAYYPDLSTSLVGPNQYQVNGPETVITAANRLGGANDHADKMTAPDGFPYPIPQGSAGYGTDILLNNVVSFQVLLMTSPPIPATLSQYAFGPDPLFPRVPSWTFDTGQNPVQQRPDINNFQQTLRVRAVQIKLRIYDSQNSVTRQVTITQDL